MDSDEDDEEPVNEPGTSANSQPTAPVLPYYLRPADSSHGPAAPDNSGNEDNEYSDEQSAQRQDVERILFYPDLYVLTDDEHWIMTKDTHMYVAAARSFCSVKTEIGGQQDICNLITVPCVQRSLCLN